MNKLLFYDVSVATEEQKEERESSKIQLSKGYNYKNIHKINTIPTLRTYCTIIKDIGVCFFRGEGELKEIEGVCE